MKNLRKIGFEVLRGPGRNLQVTGRITAGKLADLTGLEAVRYVVRRGR